MKTKKEISDQLKGMFSEMEARLRRAEELRIKRRLSYLKEQIKKECISYGETAELQSLAEHIDKGDVELLECAGVKEFGEDRFCVKCGKTSDLIDSEDMCYTCANERGRV